MTGVYCRQHDREGPLSPPRQGSSSYDTSPEEFLSMTFLSDLTPTDSMGSSTTDFLSDHDRDDVDDHRERDYNDEDQGSTIDTKQKLDNKKRNAIWEDAMRPILFPTPSEEDQGENSPIQPKESSESPPPSVGYSTTRNESTIVNRSSTIEFYSDSDDGNTDQGSTYIAIKEEFKKMNEILKEEIRLVLSTKNAEDCDESTKDEMSTVSQSHDLLKKELSLATDALLMEHDDNTRSSVKQEGPHAISSKPSEDDEDEMTEDMSALNHVQEMLRQELAMVYEALNIELLSDYDEDGDDFTDRGSTYLAIKEEFNRANTILKNEMQTVLLSQNSEEYEDELPEEMRTLSFAQDLQRQELARADEEINSSSLDKAALSAEVSSDGHREASLVHFEMDDTFCEVVESPVEAEKREGPQSERRNCLDPRSETYNAASKDAEQPFDSIEQHACNTILPTTTSKPHISKKLTIATTGERIPHDIESECKNSSSWDDSRRPTPFSEATSRRESASGQLGDPSFKSSTNEYCPSYTFTTSLPTPSSVATISEGNETKCRLNNGEIKSVRAEPNEFIEILHDLRIETNTVGCMGDHQVADTVLRDESFNTKTTLYYDAIQSFASDPTVDTLPPDSLSAQSENDGKPPLSPSKSPGKHRRVPRTAISMSKTNNTRAKDNINEATRELNKVQTKIEWSEEATRPCTQIVLQKEHELIGNVMLPESSTKKTSCLELVVKMEEVLVNMQSTDLIVHGEQGGKDQTSPSSPAMQLSNRCSPEICAGHLSPRSQCSFRSEKTTMSQASAQRAHETLRYELQMIESLDLRSETEAASPRSQTTPEQIIKRLESQLDVYQELENINVKLLAVKARASPKATDMEFAGTPNRRILDLQTSNNDHGEIEVPNGPSQGDTATISPLHSLRSHSMDDFTSIPSGEYSPAIVLHLGEDSMLEDRRTEEHRKSESIITGPDIDRQWGAQVAVSDSDSSQNRNTLNLILQEETDVTSTELIDLGTFGLSTIHSIRAMYMI